MDLYKKGLALLLSGWLGLGASSLASVSDRSITSAAASKDAFDMLSDLKDALDKLDEMEDALRQAKAGKRPTFRTPLADIEGDLQIQAGRLTKLDIASKWPAPTAIPHRPGRILNEIQQYELQLRETETSLTEFRLALDSNKQLISKKQAVADRIIRFLESPAEQAAAALSPTVKAALDKAKLDADALRLELNACEQAVRDVQNRVNIRLSAVKLQIANAEWILTTPQIRQIYSSVDVSRSAFAQQINDSLNNQKAQLGQLNENTARGANNSLTYAPPQAPPPPNTGSGIPPWVISVQPNAPCPPGTYQAGGQCVSLTMRAK